MHRRTRVLLIVCVGIFIASLDLFIVNIAFPDIQADFAGSTLSSLSWILNAYAIVLAALLVPTGRWADTFGRKRAFLLGVAVFTAASAACALAPSVGFLVGARVIQGAGAALMLPTSLGLLLPEFPPERRHVAIGAWAAAGGVAAAAGPPIGGLLVEVSWHWVFLVNIPIGIAALVAGRWVLAEIRDPAAARPDVAGGLLVALGIGALVLAIVKGGDWGWGAGETVAALLVAATALAVFVWRCTTHPAPIVEPEIVRVRSFSLAVAGAALFFVAFAAMLLAAVLFLTTVWDESVLAASLMLATGPATAALFSVPGARAGASVGPRAVGALGALLFALGGVWWLTQLGDGPDFAGGLLPGMVLGGAGVGLVNPSLTAIAAASLPAERLATGAALLTMGRQVGSALGVAVLVPILGTPTGAASFDGAWLFMLAAAAAAAVPLAAARPARAPAPLAAPAGEAA